MISEIFRLYMSEDSQQDDIRPQWLTPFAGYRSISRLLQSGGIFWPPPSTFDLEGLSLTVTVLFMLAYKHVD